jgi:hypothetical protein
LAPLHAPLAISQVSTRGPQHSYRHRHRHRHSYSTTHMYLCMLACVSLHACLCIFACLLVYLRMLACVSLHACLCIFACLLVEQLSVLSKLSVHVCCVLCDVRCLMCAVQCVMCAVCGNSLHSRVLCFELCDCAPPSFHVSRLHLMLLLLEMYIAGCGPVSIQGLAVGCEL